jgi:hypothetical protein
MMPQARRQTSLALAVLVLWSCAKPVPHVDASPNPENSAGKEDPADPPRDCVEVVRQILGPQAEIVKYGNLDNPSVPEAVAVIRLRRTLDGAAETPISQAVILRRSTAAWKPALRIGKQITNEAGYIGIDYVDDSYDFHGYRFVLHDRRPDGGRGLTVELSYLNSGGEIDGIPIVISWNEKVGRYQEYTSNQDPPGFRSELKSPPHIKSRRTP